MKRAIIALLVVTIVYAALPLATHANSVSFQVKDKYILNKGLRLFDGPVFQTDLYLTLPHGLYADLWWSTNFDTHFSENFADELDYTFGWAAEFKGLTLDASITYYDLVGLFSTKGGDALQLALEVAELRGGKPPRFRRKA
jgi:hypothetical protein